MKLCKAGVPFVVRVVATIQQPIIDERFLLTAALEPEGSKRILEETHFILLGQVIDPDIDERINQVLLSANAIVKAEVHSLGRPRFGTRHALGLQVEPPIILVDWN